ncbi:hypothetical protein CN070_21750 [Sinorhizobium meliloti]|nr:hypothetical protein CN070_21750 [Sinorhizobium meliloti]
MKHLRDCSRKVRDAFKYFRRGRPVPAKERDLNQILGLHGENEPEVIIRLRENAEWFRARGYPESHISARAKLQTHCNMEAGRAAKGGVCMGVEALYGRNSAPP